MTLYTGVTTDVRRRVNEHNSSKKGSKYTRSRRPVRLVHTEQFECRSTAQKRESRIKRLSRKEKLRVINETS